MAECSAIQLLNAEEELQVTVNRYLFMDTLYCRCTIPVKTEVKYLEQQMHFN